MKKDFSNRGFKISLILGGFLILLVLVVGISFFWAIYSTQVDRRKDFLEQQTDLAGRGLENEFERFEEESAIFLGELEEHTAKNRLDEIGKLARKMLTTFPLLVDSLWVTDPQGVVTSYVYTERNDFIQQVVPDFPLDSLKPNLLLEGKMGHRILFSTTISRFARDYLENFYQVPGGGSFLFQNETLTDIGSTSLPHLKEVQIEEFEGVKKDLYQGVKGLYSVTWKQEGSPVNGVLAQYPFSFGDLVHHMGLVIILPLDDLRTGVYRTYFLLFMGMIIILVILLSIFVISVRNYLDFSKSREESLKEVTELFDQQNMLLRELRGFVFFHDYRGQILRTSHEVEEVLGYSRSDFNVAFNDGVTHPVVQTVKDSIKNAYLARKEFVDMEFDIQRGDGRQIRLRIFEKITYDKLGRFAGGLGICTDISVQHAAKLKIIQSEDQLRTVLNNLPDEIFIYDNQGEVLEFHVQPRGKYLDLTQARVGKKLEKFIPKDQAAGVTAAFQEARRTGKIQTVDVNWMELNSQRQMYYEMRFFPLDEEQMISISKDITSQKIWEKGLLDAMHAADQANKSKSEFLANMSHEIRTPLNGLLGMIDLLESTELDQIQSQYLEIVKNSGNSLLTIIRDILDYSKIEAGKVDIHVSAFSPVEEVKAQLEILGGIAKKKAISLLLEEELGSTLVVEADRDKINQILLNLIGNALKFTPEGGKVSVILTQEYLGHNLLMLHYTIQDTGIGISQENILRLTQPFFQVESSATRSYQGTGLGLAIAKKMIELLGGELEVQSEPGQGATFQFSVLAKVKQEAWTLVVKEDLPQALTEDLGKSFPLQILIAEDNDLNLQLMGLMFKQLGYGFEVAKNGKEAVEKVIAQDFDLVFMDVQMPIMNGLEATEEIRKLPQGKQLILIGLSANAFEDDQNKALEVGMDDYLTKPLRLAVLAGKLEQYYRKLKVQPQG
ncbi:MAG: ATP-binding protein [Algoriphagus sp.]|nr:ATP-binding protein [Algoriphagus sp.]